MGTESENKKKKAVVVKKKKIDTSKKLAFFNTVVWLGVLIFCLIAWTKTRSFPEALFNGVTAQYSVCLVAYMSKSGYENRDIKALNACQYQEEVHPQEYF